jgi:hypothetical protein
LVEIAAGMDERNGAPITVADEEGILNFEGIKEPGEYLLGLLVHIVNRPG